MGEKCNTVVFSNRAYNAIIRESFKKNPVETGGILLGHIVDDTWVVIEVLPPGKHSIFEAAYFEYDKDFVNYLADSVSNQYEYPLELLGLWHRHPGSMDVFSGTDDVTNTTFASLNSKGMISGLVNIDPKFRFTMYHLDNPVKQTHGRPCYKKIEVIIGDDVIPPVFFELRYVNSAESDLHPTPIYNGGKGSQEYIGNNNASRDNLQQVESQSAQSTTKDSGLENNGFIKPTDGFIHSLTTLTKRDLLFFFLGVFFTCAVKLFYRGLQNFVYYINHQ